jgi:hypothetical protein
MEWTYWLIVGIEKLSENNYVNVDARKIRTFCDCYYQNLS